MEVQVEVSHAKNDRRAGIIATIAVHAILIALLIWAVLPKSDPPIEQLGGPGFEVGLGGIEGEGASGAAGGGEQQPSEQTPNDAVVDNQNDPNPQEDLISNAAEDPIKVSPKTNPTTPKKTSKTPKDPKKQTTPVDPNQAKLDELNKILGSNGGKDGGGGTGTDGNGPGGGKTGLGKGSNGTGTDASNGRGNAKPTRILTALRKEDHSCSGSSKQVVKIEISKSGKMKVTGNSPGTIGADECFKRRAEQYVLSNYVYAPCSDCNSIRYDEAVLTLESTDQ